MTINTSTVDTIIGSRVRDRRNLIGITIREMAARASLSVGFISDLENGKRGISAENLLSLARALDVAPGWFFAPLTDKSLVTPDPKGFACYVKHHGASCPYCGNVTQPTRRLIAGARAEIQDDGQRSLSVQCYCCMCNNDWMETYRLVAATPIKMDTQ